MRLHWRARCVNRCGFTEVLFSGVSGLGCSSGSRLSEEARNLILIVCGGLYFVQDKPSELLCFQYLNDSRGGFSRLCRVVLGKMT